LQITCKLLANYLQITCKLLANYLQITCKNFSYKPSILLLCVGLLVVYKSKAQSNKLYAENGSLSYLIIENPSEQLVITNPQAIFQKYLQPNKDIAFVLIDDQTTEDGNRHQKFQQYYKGILVEHGIYILHANKSKVYAIGGEFYPITTIPTETSLSEKQVLQSTLKTIGATKYAWEDVVEENNLKNVREDNTATNYPKGELVIWHHKQQDNRTETYRLCYKFSISSVEPHYSANYYVDANSGEILANFSNSCSIEGDGQTAYNGVKRIVSRQVSPTSFLLADDTRKIQTEDIATDIFSNNSANWLNLSNARKEAGVSAHWGVMRTHDYFLSTHNRKGYDGSGAKVLNYIARDGYDNANFLNGTITCGVTPFGRFWVSLDVMAHEWAHGVCKTTSNSIYSGESGALNESFSDIWGITVKQNNSPSYPFSANWLIGDDFILGGLRDMANPKSKGQPDTYKGINWQNGGGDFGGIHTNSGVMNHWFYILCEGKTGRNDKGYNYSVTPIFRDRVAQIVYRTESVHLAPNDGYIQMANKSLLATKEMFGLCSPEYVSVWNAWYAVGVFTVPYTAPTPSILLAPTIVCNEANSYQFLVKTIDSFLGTTISNTQYRWELTVGGRLQMNGTSSVSIETMTNEMNITVLADLGGIYPWNYWETLKITPLDCPLFKPIYYNFWVGKPEAIGELNNYYPYICTTYGNPVEVNPVAGATTYQWISVSPSLRIVSTGTNTATLYVDRQRFQPTEVGFIVIAANECSILPRNFTDLDTKSTNYSWRYFTMPVRDDYSCFGVINPDPIITKTANSFIGFPNPAENMYTITSENKNTTDFSYKITNSIGSLISEGKILANHETKLDVSQFANGLYVVQIQSGNKIEFLKFVVQRGSIAN
jgi:Zn-dependent metalloprotease